jgi:hypothetical protein
MIEYMKSRTFSFSVFLWTIVLCVVPPAPSRAEPLYSPTWGFRLDLPEGYELSGGDSKNQFSFSSSFGAFLDLAVYTEKASVGSLADELEKKLSNKGKKTPFEYNGKKAVMIELRFPNPRQRNSFNTGWGLCVELDAVPGSPPESGAKSSLLFVMAYGPDRAELQSLHLSCLDSIAAGEGDRRLPGPWTAFKYPRGKWILSSLAGLEEKAYFREGDARAAQVLVDREFEVLKRYLTSPLWQEAWKRFYRAIHRDAFDRLAHAAFILERKWNLTALDGPDMNAKADENEKTPSTAEAERALGSRDEEARRLAEKTLQWVQNFKYERDFMGSDFVNLISAVQEGRGDCDSRAMLWAIVLEHANIPAALMVSREFSHAMGLADIGGRGARFPFKDGAGKDQKWLVAETTAPVVLGLIGEGVSEITKWTAIEFE